MYFGTFDPARGERLQILDAGGALRDDLRPALPDDEVKRLYGRLVAMREADAMALKLQREGRMGTYAPVLGQEACQAAGAVLGPDDWLVPSYRETGAMWLRGVPLTTIYRYWMGDEWGSSFPEGVNVLPVAIPVGSQPLHAVGLAWALKLQGRRAAVLTCFGDGASSEGEVHEAMNFAGVFGLPVVFFCQNNQFAISVPRSRQTAAPTIAQRAQGYGFPGLQVDGNDLFAVWGAVAEALEDGRQGRGPRLVEALTYRLGPHTTADDPTKYRSDDEVEARAAEDPLRRLQAYLGGRGLLSSAEEEALAEAARREVAEAVAAAEAAIRPRPEEMFDFTYEALPAHLARQRTECLEFLSRRREGRGHG